MLDKRDPIADNVGAGYQAWCDGKPLSDDAGADFAEGWNVAADADWWKRLADRVGFVVTGFSGRYAASVLWPDQSTSEISGGLLAALEASSRQEERLRLALGRIAALNDLSGVPDADLEAAARAKLYESELIARAALEPPHAKDAADV